MRRAPVVHDGARDRPARRARLPRPNADDPDRHRGRVGDDVRRRHDADHDDVGRVDEHRDATPVRARPHARDRHAVRRRPGPGDRAERQDRQARGAATAGQRSRPAVQNLRVGRAGAPAERCGPSRAPACADAVGRGAGTRASTGHYMQITVQSALDKLNFKAADGSRRPLQVPVGRRPLVARRHSTRERRDTMSRPATPNSPIPHPPATACVRRAASARRFSSRERDHEDPRPRLAGQARSAAPSAAPAGPTGAGAPPQMGTAVTGATLTKLTAAATTRHPGTVERAMKLSDGSYVVHVIRCGSAGRTPTSS